MRATVVVAPQLTPIAERPVVSAYDMAGQGRAVGLDDLPFNAEE